MSISVTVTVSFTEYVILKTFDQTQYKRILLSFLTDFKKGGTQSILYVFFIKCKTG